MAPSATSMVNGSSACVETGGKPETDKGLVLLFYINLLRKTNQGPPRTTLTSFEADIHNYLMTSLQASAVTSPTNLFTSLH
jgi:hypothetical protein